MMMFVIQGRGGYGRPVWWVGSPNVFHTELNCCLQMPNLNDALLQMSFINKEASKQHQPVFVTDYDHAQIAETHWRNLRHNVVKLPG